MLDSAIVYAGLLLIITGLISVISPVRMLRIRTRVGGALVVLSGTLIVVVALMWPISTSAVSVRRTRLDEFMPEWQFNEIHGVHVAAPPDRVFAAIRAVTADEIPLFQLLTTIRRGGRPGPESILNAPGQRPLLDVATATSFVMLADAAPRELVVGTVIAAPPQPRARLAPDVFRGRPGPGVTLAAMNFAVALDQEGGSTVSTETRVRSGDPSAARRFAIYWRVIHPGSDIIRRMWLLAIKRRAERS